MYIAWYENSSYFNLLKLSLKSYDAQKKWKIPRAKFYHKNQCESKSVSFRKDAVGRDQ